VVCAPTVLLPTKTGYVVVSVEVTGFIVIFEAVLAVVAVVAVEAFPVKAPLNISAVRVLEPGL
jgi:hypothetical protein